MAELLDALEVAQTVIFVLLAVFTLRQWVRHRDAPSAWAAATFATLGAVVLVGIFLPEDPSGAALWAEKALVAVLLLFPYLLYRFASSFRPFPRAVDAAAGVLTAVACGSIFLFDELPEGDDERTDAFTAYLVLVLAYWTVLTLVVAVSLWRSGRGRPTVVRRRMRTLAVAALGLVAALLLSSTGSDDDDRNPNAVDVVTAVLVIAIGPLFLVGLTPPALLLAAWRRPEEEALYDAEAALMGATSTADVAAGVLPHVVRTTGGAGAALIRPDGTAVASYGPVPRDGAGGTTMSVPLRTGRLTVAADAYTPFFGRSEQVLLERIARLADLALQRAELADRERAVAADLEAANEAMRDFVAIASHDLRTPIAAIRGYAQLIDGSWDSLPDADKREHARTIARQAGHLSRIVTDLLTVSRLDTGALQPEREPVAVGDVVRQIVGDLRLGHDVEVDVDEGTEVHADVDHVTRIVRNLVENADSYGDPPIVVSARRNGSHVELRVRDHGDGVPEDFLPRLFGRFARSDRSASRSKHGTGLGLSIVRGLARAGGGDAWYEPAGPGACFAVRLPAHPEEPCS